MRTEKILGYVRDDEESTRQVHMRVSCYLVSHFLSHCYPQASILVQPYYHHHLHRSGLGSKGSSVSEEDKAGVIRFRSLSGTALIISDGVRTLSCVFELAGYYLFREKRLATFQEVERGQFWGRPKIFRYIQDILLPSFFTSIPS